MTLAQAQPERRPYQRRLPRAASPDQFDQMVQDEIAELRGSAEAYRWLYPSGYAKGRKGPNEKVRRDVSGAGGDLADGYDGLDRIRRYLDQASDHQRKSLAHALGAGAALGRGQDRLDKISTPTLVALDPLAPAMGDKPFTPEHLRGMTPTEAKERQGLRNARLSRDGVARQHRQEELAAAVIRCARKLIEDGTEAPPLAAAIESLDKESASSVSVPWSSQESVG